MDRSWMGLACIVGLSLVIGTQPARSADEVPQATGEATVVLDGETSKWNLLTDAGSGTTFQKPRQAVLVYQEVDGELEPDTVPRRLAITFDGRKPPGSVSTNDASVNFHLINEDGQYLFPRSNCNIRFESTWTGAPDSVVEGRVGRCTIRKLRTNREIVVDFEMKGTPRPE